MGKTVANWVPAKVKFYNAAKGFGFVTLDDEVDVFVNRAVFEGCGLQQFDQGVAVECKVYEHKGRLRAAELRRVS